MRYRVDCLWGYASFDESDKAKAYALYDVEGLRIRRGLKLGQEDEIVEGLPFGINVRKAAAA